MKHRRMHGNEGGRHTVEDLVFAFAIAEAHVDMISTCEVKETESVHHTMNLTEFRSRRPERLELLSNGADACTCVNRKSQTRTLVV